MHNSHILKLPYQESLMPELDPLPRFVLHWHEATTHHFDLRLETKGVFPSWAVRERLSLDPQEPLRAVETTVHTDKCWEKEGRIPPGNYGAGPIILSDRCRYRLIDYPEISHNLAFEIAYITGVIRFCLESSRMPGIWRLERSPKDWLLYKESDVFISLIDLSQLKTSILTGKTTADL
jgi:bifunctional non-homologous end joining protein LigD